MPHDSNGSMDGLLADIAKRRRHHQRMAFVAFWLHELFFYCALTSSCVAAVMALAKNSEGLAFKVISGLPALSLLVIGTAPFSARSVWHGEFADRLDAASREMKHEGKSASDASAELTRLTDAMKRRYPQARWNTGAGSSPSKGEEKA